MAQGRRAYARLGRVALTPLTSRPDFLPGIPNTRRSERDDDQQCGNPLSPQTRAAAIEALAGGDELDILVVGGGVTGVGCALDAVTRGLRTGLVEQRDFASGTSSRSSKLIHGGLRYLEMFDFRLVAEALKERGLLLTRLAPHLVRPVPFLYPLTKAVVERPYVEAGLTMYDTMARASKHAAGLPWHKHLTRRQACGSPRR